jgi:hypothetical protein
LKTIYKYSIETTDEQIIEMPAGAKILTVQPQGAFSLCLWAEVDTEQPKEQRTLLTYGTGHPMRNTQQRYIGTYQLQGGGLVFHVYEEA